MNWCATQHEEICFAAKTQKFHFIENISFVLIAASRLLLSLKNSSLFSFFFFFNTFFFFFLAQIYMEVMWLIDEGTGL